MFKRFVDNAIKIPRIHRLCIKSRSLVFSTIFDDLENLHAQRNLYVPKSKISVIGLPKSGNNWLMGLISQCLDMEVLDNKASPKSGVFLTSQPFSTNMYFSRDINFAVYMMRDLRDIVCSYYHYIKPFESDGGRHAMARFDDIESFYFEYFLPHLSLLYDYPNHTAGYLKYDIPIVKYEKLWDNTERELSRLFERWGIEVSSSKISESVADNQFEKLKKSGKDKLGHHLPKDHMRKGGYGNYEDELPASVLTDIEQRFGPFLKDWGYLV